MSVFFYGQHFKVIQACFKTFIVGLGISILLSKMKVCKMFLFTTTATTKQNGRRRRRRREENSTTDDQIDD